MRPRTKVLGIGIPVLISISLCLTVPFIVLLANMAILMGAICAYVADMGTSPSRRTASALGAGGRDLSPVEKPSLID